MPATLARTTFSPPTPATQGPADHLLRLDPRGQQHPPSTEQSSRLCQTLEEGRILFFPIAPFAVPTSDVEFLRSQKQSGSRFHKNIAYRPLKDKLTGYDAKDADFSRLHAVMRNFSQTVTRFLTELLPHYATKWRLDYASFRPLQEQGRKVRLHARNDLLHVDAFPTRPTCGDRILRVFTNINPSDARRWITSEPFHLTVHKLAGTDALPWPRPASNSPWQAARSAARKAARALGLPVVLRSPYDEFMIRMYRHMKENDQYQANCLKNPSQFPPGSAWIVFTDGVPHAALFGQYALEQTFIISRQSLVCPDKAPANVLEAVCGGPLTQAA